MEFLHVVWPVEQSPIDEYAHQLLSEWAERNGHRVTSDKCECGAEVDGLNWHEVQAHWRAMRETPIAA